MTTIDLKTLKIHNHFAADGVAFLTVYVTTESDAGLASFVVRYSDASVSTRWDTVGAQHAIDFRPSPEALRELAVATRKLLGI